MDLPIDDVVKIGSSASGGVGLMALFARYLRNDNKRIEAAQAEVNKKLWKKSDEIANALVEHRIEGAKTFVSRDEFSVFRTHMDDQFEKTRAMIFDLVRDKK